MLGTGPGWRGWRAARPPASSLPWPIPLGGTVPRIQNLGVIFESSFSINLKSITWRLFLLTVSLVPILYRAVAQHTAAEILVAHHSVLLFDHVCARRLGAP